MYPSRIAAIFSVCFCQSHVFHPQLSASGIFRFFQSLVIPLIKVHFKNFFFISNHMENSELVGVQLHLLYTANNEEKYKHLTLTPPSFRQKFDSLHRSEVNS